MFFEKYSGAMKNDKTKELRNLILQLSSLAQEEADKYGVPVITKIQEYLNFYLQILDNSFNVLGELDIAFFEEKICDITLIRNANSARISLYQLYRELTILNSYIKVDNTPISAFRNSEKFYENEINKIKKEKETLVSEIDDLKEKLNHTQEEAAESEKHRAELSEKEKELRRYINLTEKYEAEKREQDRINDSIKVWNDKIKKAFETLKEYIKPIKKEHNRLSYLYWGYLGLSAILIICLAIIEFNICQKIMGVDGLPTWEQYFSVVLPIPITLALLWGFIHEMNRSQRQLVILAKQIHEVEYVEGLLLTINTLSTDIDNSVSRINNAIDKLLENHLTYRDKLLLDEKLLKKEEGKDEMPHEATLKILKVVNELVSNKK